LGGTVCCGSRICADFLDGQVWSRRVVQQICSLICLMGGFLDYLLDGLLACFPKRGAAGRADRLLGGLLSG
jgi:hypothetical protein